VPQTLEQIATDRLVKLSAGPVRPYSTVDFGRDRKTACISVVVPNRDAERIVQNLRTTLPRGLLAFIGTTQWLGDEKHTDETEIVVGPGESQFEIIELAETDAANYDLQARQIVGKLQEYDHMVGINIIHAETDTVEFDLLKLPIDLTAFVADLYEFCPDIGPQGAGSIVALAAQIRKVRRVCLWWD